MCNPTDSAGGKLGYVERLGFTESSDGLPLEGAVMSPDGAQNDLAIVWIHGGASKFCERHYIALGRRLATRGYLFLTGNTRGHDGFSIFWRSDEVVLGGSSFERFEECPRDISAWIDFALQVPCEGVILAGHSLGASKVAYYQASKQDERVRALVAVSPPAGWQSNTERVALADRMVSEGRGEDLMPELEGAPKWNIVSAQMIASREAVLRHAFDSDSKIPYIGRLRCPLLITYGSDEEVEASWLDTVRNNAGARVDTGIVQGAGHDYAGQEAELADLLVGWIGSMG
jgi:pimeloyl-ACP methyl ester carboxylesterase